MRHPHRTIRKTSSWTGFFPTDLFHGWLHSVSEQLAPILFYIFTITKKQKSIISTYSWHRELMVSHENSPSSMMTTFLHFIHFYLLQNIIIEAFRINTIIYCDSISILKSTSCLFVYAIMCWSHRFDGIQIHMNTFYRSNILYIHTI